MKLEGYYMRRCFRCGSVFATRTRSARAICKECNKSKIRAVGFLLNDVI